MDNRRQKTEYRRQKNEPRVTNRRRGAALLIVLFIVMAATILAIGFLSRSDTELACGKNMVLRTQMDYLAESGLEHARGMILNPQDTSSEYWTGGTSLQIAAGSNDYYDVAVVRNDANRCNYDINCVAYRLRGSEEVGRANLRAELRLNPCIALWVGSGTTIPGIMTVNGDVDCNSGTLTNQGVINGDVFSSGWSENLPTGQIKATADLSLTWPRVTVADFLSHYSYQTIGTSSLDNTTLSGSTKVFYCNGSLALNNNVQIDGMLIVNGNLKITGSENTITAQKNLPALLTTGNLVLGGDSSLDINGLAVVEGQVQTRPDNAQVSVQGGLFTKYDMVETTIDSTANDNVGVLYNGPTWRPVTGGRINGALEFDGSDDRVEDPCAGSYLNGLSACTVSVWVKSDVINVDRGIMYTRNPTDNDEELGMRYDKDGAYGGAVRCIKASIRATSGYTQIESKSYTQTTDWQHLALVWTSGSSLKLYINGQLSLPLSYDKGPVWGTVSGVQKLMVGYDTKSKYWDGLIDDLRIYNRELSAADINNLYLLNDITTGLLTHWKLDEDGTGNITITAEPAKAAVIVWSQDGVAEKWGQAAGAFYKSIRRN